MDLKGKFMPPITKARKKTILRHCSHSGLHYPRLIPFLFSSVNEISCRSGSSGWTGELFRSEGLCCRKGITSPSCRGPAYSSGPWPGYYLINFILSSQYSSFPKAVLSIRVTIQPSAVTPPGMKSDEGFCQAPCPPLEASSPSSGPVVAVPRLRCHLGCMKVMLVARGRWGDATACEQHPKRSRLSVCLANSLFSHSSPRAKVTQRGFFTEHILPSVLNGLGLLEVKNRSGQSSP